LKEQGERKMEAYDPYDWQLSPEFADFNMLPKSIRLPLCMPGLTKAEWEMLAEEGRSMLRVSLTKLSELHQIVSLAKSRKYHALTYNEFEQLATALVKFNDANDDRYGLSDRAEGYHRQILIEYLHAKGIDVLQAEPRPPAPPLHEFNLAGSGGMERLSSLEGNIRLKNKLALAALSV
jgi:hypothetical protein